MSESNEDNPLIVSETFVETIFTWLFYAILECVIYPCRPFQPGAMSDLFC